LLLLKGYDLLEINGSQAFWIFTIIELVFLGSAVISARLVSPKKPNKIKVTTFECGQDPINEAKSYRILGITRYFGYAVAFFALDAFAWVILTSALSVSITATTVSVIALYAFIIFTGIAYFLVEKDKLV
jgi:NADH:ubiquinone oxidoreductase subunit 3 (subunit A)